MKSIKILIVEALDFSADSRLMNNVELTKFIDHHINNSDRLEHVIDHANITPDHLSQILANPDSPFTVTQKALSHRLVRDEDIVSTSENHNDPRSRSTALYASLNRSKQLFDKQITKMARGDYNDTMIRSPRYETGGINVLKSPHVKPEHITQLLDSSVHSGVKQGLLDPRESLSKPELITPEHIMLGLSDGDANIRGKAAGHPNNTTQTVQMALSDPDPDVRAIAITKNGHHLDHDMKMAAVNDPERRVREVAYYRRDLPREAYDHLSTAEHQTVRAGVLTTAPKDHPLFQELMNGSESYFASKVAFANRANKDLSDEERLKAIDVLVNHKDAPTDEGQLHPLFYDTHVPESLLRGIHHEKLRDYAKQTPHPWTRDLINRHLGE